MWLPLFILNFVSAKNLVLISNWWTLWAISFFTENVYTYHFTKKEYCTAHKYSTETVNNASCRRINIFNHCYVQKVECKCKSGSRLSNAANQVLKIAFSRFCHNNLFIILVLSILHRRSCSILLIIRLFSLFYLMVLFCSFYHVKFT